MRVGIVYRARVALIKFAKVFPFILCLILFISYLESLFAICFRSYALYDGCMTLNTPISWFIARYYEYDMYAILVAILLSISVETCIYNKLGILYLFMHLCTKPIISSIEISVLGIILIIVANLCINAFFISKGLKIVLKSKL